MHGISAVPADGGGTWVFFSSSGLPPRGIGDALLFSHDIYVSRWAGGKQQGEPSIFIGQPGAQEPVSAARNASGRIMVTWEDSFDTTWRVIQRCRVYDAALQPVNPSPKDVAGNSHSGHVAAVGDYFIVFYSYGWVKGDSIDNLGTGNGVCAAIYDGSGTFIKRVPVALHSREWWPLVAGGKTHALLAWQKFVPGAIHAEYHIALLSPASGEITAQRLLRTELACYSYAVAYVEALDGFLVTGTANGEGFACLIDNSGDCIAELGGLPATVREAGLLVDGHAAYVPAAGNRLLQLALAPGAIQLTKVHASPIAWETLGSAGFRRGDSDIQWLQLSRRGLEEARFTVTP